MKTTTTHLIDLYMKEIKVRSDRQVCVKLGLGSGTVSRYRSGSTMDYEIARKVCKTLNLDVEYYTAKLEADRQITPERKKLWLSIAKRISSSAAVVAVAITLLQTEAVTYQQWLLC